MKHVIHEVIAGLSSFFTFSYVLILLPEILSTGGLDYGSALTATSVTLCCATLLLALISNYPIIVGPGLGIAVFLIFSIVEPGKASIHQVLGLVFWTGVIELFLTLCGARQKILIHMPPALKQGAPAGIGLFFIVLGLKQLDLITINENTYSLGTFGTPGQTIGLCGLLLFVLLHKNKKRSAFLLPILLCWILALLLGLSELTHFFSFPPPLTFAFPDLTTIWQPQLWPILLSILLIALFDAGAALTALLAPLYQHNTKNFLEQKTHRALFADGIGSIIASFTGSTTCTFCAESSSGIKAGGKTWIVGATISLCSLLALFCYPALLSIPRFATAPSLIGLGSLMTTQIGWTYYQNPREWIPFLITALTMPLLFNIYLGIAFGFISYTIVHLISGRGRELHPIVWGLALLFTLYFAWTSAM